MKRLQLDLHRFEKVLGLLDSANEGEALAALGRAKHLLVGAGISFNELKVGISSFQGDDQGIDMGDAVEAAHVQKLEDELETLRWSHARQELQIATLRQSVEEKSTQIQKEQTKRHSYEGELVGLRKAHAVQMEEALNRKDEAEKLAKQLEVYKAVEKVTGVGPNTSIRDKASKIAKAATGVKSHKKNSKAKLGSGASNARNDVRNANFTSSNNVSPSEGLSKGRASKFVASKENTSVIMKAASQKKDAAIRQGALNLIGGEDKSLGKEYRWERIEEKHQMVVEEADVRGEIRNGAHGTIVSQRQAIDIQAEA